MTLRVNRRPVSNRVHPCQFSRKPTQAHRYTQKYIFLYREKRASVEAEATRAATRFAG